MNYIRINDNFSISEGSTYDLVSDKLCRINSPGILRAYVADSTAVAWAADSIAYDGIYSLMMSPDGRYVAGCRGPFTREQALKHWDRDDDRALLFTFAILMCSE